MKRFTLFSAAFFIALSSAFSQNVLVPFSLSSTTTACSGTIQDHAGSGNYSNGANGFLVIDPPGNGTVSLSFTQFQTENGYDYVRIYNGVGISGTLLGSYSGSALPNGGNPFVSTSGAMTVRFTSDGSQTAAGFTANFSSAGGSAAPVASFTASSTSVLFNNPVTFTNTSLQQVQLWIFGDGNTSTDQNPSHSYTSAGSFLVKQIVSNCLGATDTATLSVTVLASPNGFVSVDTVHISVPCGGTNSANFTIGNGTGGGTMNFNLALNPNASTAEFYAPFEGAGLDGFVNQTPSIYTTTLKNSGAAQGNQYLEFVGDGVSLDGLKATFPPSQAKELSYYVKSDSYGSYSGYIDIGGLNVSNAFTRIFNSVFYYNSLRLYYKNGTSLTYYNYPISQGVWYKIELKNIDYATESYQVYVNGVLVLPNAKFYYSVSSLSQIQVYNNVLGTIGLDEFYVGNQNLTNSITYSPTTGVLASGNSSTIFINANASGLNAGNYYMDYVISSNDTALNGLIIPLELTVTGQANLTQSATCFNYGAVYNSQILTDSVLFTNTGCDTLNISTITKTSNAITLNTAPFNVAPNDSAWVNFTFSANALGSVADSIYLSGPDTNTYICISANVTGAPIISTDSTAYHVNFMGCPDTVSFPFIIYNTGLSALNWGTSGVVSANLNDNFDAATINANIWSTWSSGVTQGTTCGVINGTRSLIFNGSGQRYIQTIPLNTSSGGTISFKYNQSTCEFADGGEGLYVFYSTNNGVSWTQIQYFYVTNYLTQIASMAIPTGAQGSNIIFKIQQSVNSGSGFDYWTIDDFSINSGITNAMIFTPDTGAIAIGGSTNVLAKIVTTGLTSGVYNLFAYVSSNDPLNPLLTIPVTFTLTGQPDIVLPNNCAISDSTMKGFSSTDSVLVYNDGCADLVITNAFTATAHFTAQTTSATIPAGDTAYFVFSFNPTTIGAKIDSLSFTSNAPFASVCLRGFALDVPIIDVNSSLISVVLNTCSDSVLVPLTIKNIGASFLNFKVEGSAADTIKILAITTGYSYNNYLNTLTALDNYMTSPYAITTINTASSTVLAAALVEADVLFIPPLIYNYYTTYTAIAPAVQAYVNAGGKMIACGTALPQNIKNLGVFVAPGSTYQDYGGLALSVLTPYQNHPAVQGLSATPTSADRTYYNGVTNANTRKIMVRSNLSTYFALNEVDYGSGEAMWLGFNYATSNIDVDKILANTMQAYGAANLLPDWLSAAPDSGAVFMGDSTIINIKFNAKDLASGTYTDTLLISSNDPLNPLVKIPVQFTVNGLPEIDVATSCIGFDTILVGLADMRQTLIKNTGCDTLVISSATSNSGMYSLLNLPIEIAPFDSVFADVQFLPTTLGYYADTLQVFSNVSPVGICLTGQGLGAPQVNPAVDTMRVTLNICNGFVIKPFTMQNTGQGSMNYETSIKTIYNESSSVTYTTAGALTTHQFLNTPASADTVFFMIVVNGDYNGSGGGEYYNVNVEGNAIAIYDNNVPDGTNDTSYGYYTGPNIATWLADGKVVVNIQNAYGVAPNTGLDLHYVRISMKSTPTWASILSPKIGSLAVNASTTKDILFTVGTLPVGTYNTSVVIESNDPVNPVYIVPVIFTIVNKADIEVAVSCLNFGQVVGATPIIDSVKIYNRGCKNLNITNLQFLNASFSSSVSTLTIPSKDSAWLPITLTPTVQGFLNTSLIIYSNDSTLALCLIADVNFLPQTDFDYSVNNECNGEVDFTDKTANNPLNWTWDFGDGTVSYIKNPTHFYQKPGIYNVQLISFNAAGVDTLIKSVDMTKVLYVQFQEPAAIQANVAAQFYDSSMVATQWQWYFGDGGNSTMQNPSHTYTNAGSYFVTFVASNADCSKTVSRLLTVKSGIGVDEDMLSKSVNIYPVPASNFVQIEWSANQNVTEILVFDALGNELLTQKIISNELRIDVNGFAEGNYFVKLSTKEGIVALKKFVVLH